MRAFLLREPGDPSALEMIRMERPQPRQGWIHIDIKAFGLNRAEAITRAGGSGDAVPLPRIIGIECVGTVLDGGGTDLKVGQTVAAAMGGLGRTHDGSYAEETSTPRSHVFPIETNLDWPTLAAIPETFLTASGCLNAVRSTPSPAKVVMRPGGSALGLAINEMVSANGGEVVGITRSSTKLAQIKEHGMHQVLVSDAGVARVVNTIWPRGATAVIDAVASDITISDGLECITNGGMVCLAGSLAESYGTDDSTIVIESLARPDVTYYSSETLNSDKHTDLLQEIIDRVESKEYSANIDTVFSFDQVVDAHYKMEENQLVGKGVVVL